MLSNKFPLGQLDSQLAGHNQRSFIGKQSLVKLSVITLHCKYLCTWDSSGRKHSAFPEFSSLTDSGTKLFFILEIHHLMFHNFCLKGGRQTFHLPDGWGQSWSWRPFCISQCVCDDGWAASHSPLCSIYNPLQSRLLHCRAVAVHHSDAGGRHVHRASVEGPQRWESKSSTSSTAVLCWPGLRCYSRWGPWWGSRPGAWGHPLFLQLLLHWSL